MNWIYDKQRNIYIFKGGGTADSIKENYYRQAIPIIQDELYKTYNIKDKEAVHLILGSMSFESLHGTSQLATQNYNFGGIGGRKNKDGSRNWTKFDSFESGVRHQVRHILDTFHGFENGYNPEKYIQTLKKYNYFEEPIEEYWGDDSSGWWGTYNGKTVKTYLNKYYKELQDTPKVVEAPLKEKEIKQPSSNSQMSIFKALSLFGQSPWAVK